MSEEKGINEEIINEEELDDLLEEAKGEATETKEETTKEEEVELELEEETEKEGEGEVELEVEEGTEVTGREVVEKEKPIGVSPTQALEKVVSVTQTGLVAPVCSVEQAVEIFKKFEQAKKEILTSNDVLWIGEDGRPAAEGEGSPHIKRSGWRKLARFFGLSWDIEDIRKFSMDGGGYMYKVRVKVWHPAGASVVSEGIATSKDAFFTKAGRKEADEENVIMKAQTVAVNRAISDILGSGEVSGEEEE